MSHHWEDWEEREGASTLSTDIVGGNDPCGHEEEGFMTWRTREENNSPLLRRPIQSGMWRTVQILHKCVLELNRKHYCSVSGATLSLLLLCFTVFAMKKNSPYDSRWRRSAIVLVLCEWVQVVFIFFSHFEKLLLLLTEQDKRQSKTLSVPLVVKTCEDERLMQSKHGVSAASWNFTAPHAADTPRIKHN